jgi:putative transposase
MKCSWYNNKIIKLQKHIPFPEKYNDDKINEKYSNILSDVRTNKKKYSFNLAKINETDTAINRTYKYKITFSKEQHIILQKYFNECYKIYNLCVSIWKKYNDMTDNWQILKDVIFEKIYRNENNKTHDENIQSIIDELKNKKKLYDVETEKNQKEIEKLKKIEKDKYVKEMNEYTKNKISNLSSTIKTKLTKPKLNKIKINKVKQPRKPNRKQIKKPAPDETLKGEIRTFCANLKSARTNSFNKSDVFKLENKNIDNKQTIVVSNRNISDNGIFKNSLKKMNCKNFDKIIKKHKINKECKLMYDKNFNCYYLYIVEDKLVKNEFNNRKEIVAIDPGEKIFCSYYSINETGNLGKDMRIYILKTQQKIKNYQKILKNNINKKKLSIKHKKKLKLKILKYYKKIKGYVNEIHKKSAKYLCENYEYIFLPTFETKNMISNNKIKLETERIKKINSKNDAQKELCILKKTIKMSKNIKFVLSMQSHYKFKEYLKAKAKEYKTIVHDVDESYTSQMCTKCGVLGKDYDGNRIKQCICGYKIDRDVNGSRNILLKCIESLKSSMKAG